MSDFEQKMLEDLENKKIAALVSFVLVFSPIFGLIAGAVFSSTGAMYGVGVTCAVLGVAGIVSVARERRARKSALQSTSQGLQSDR